MMNDISWIPFEENFKIRKATSNILHSYELQPIFLLVQLARILCKTSWNGQAVKENSILKRSPLNKQVSRPSNHKKAVLSYILMLNAWLHLEWLIAYNQHLCKWPSFSKFCQASCSPSKYKSHHKNYCTNDYLDPLFLVIIKAIVSPYDANGDNFYRTLSTKIIQNETPTIINQ